MADEPIQQTDAPIEVPTQAPAPVEPPATVGSYQPVGVPVAAPTPGKPGKTVGIIGIVCAVVSLLFLPPIFGIAGLICGIVALRKGRTTLGIIAIVLSAVFMVIGIILGIYVSTLVHDAASSASTTPLSSAAVELLSK